MKDEKKKKQDGNKKELLFMLVFFILSVTCIVFGLLCLGGIKKGIITRYFALWATIVTLIISLLCGSSIWFVLSKKEAWTKASLSLYILLSFVLIFLFILQKSGFFEVFQDAELLQEYLERAGIWMPILYILLQYLQVVILPIPSIVSTFAGIALFGAFWTMIYSLIGILLGSFTAFFIGRKLGYKAVAWMVGKETLDKWQQKLKGKDNLVLSLMFLLPLFPDDVLCFVAGLSSMSTKYFLGMIFVARALGIAGTCYSIDFIPFNTWWGIMLWVLFFAIVIALFILVYKNMDKIQQGLKRLKKKLHNKKRHREESQKTN